jgi:peptide/nickel transport system substrate-binding protein
MNINEALVVQQSVNGRMGYAPLLAERWETPDGKQWTLFLRKGVTFSDGTPFTAEDVLHSYNRIMTDSDSLQGAQLKSFVSEVRVVDPSTVAMNLKAPNVSFLEEVRLRVITSKAHLDKLGKDAADKAPLGTGPYTFREWIRGQRFVVAKNPTYWGQQPEPDEIVTRFILDDVGRVTALNNGEIDIADNLAPQLVSQVGNRARVVTEDSERHMFLGMRPDMKPTNNKLVRQAIYHAVDRDAIVERIQGGFASVLKGPLQSFVLGYDPTLPSYYPYDPARSKALLAQAGLPNGVSLDLYIPVTQYVKAKEVGEAVAAMLRDVGIQAEIKSPEWGTFQTEYAEGNTGAT